MRLKNLLVLALALSLVLCLCACGGEKNADPTGNDQNIEADGAVKVIYTVTVEDEYGDPISDVIVQLKSDSVVSSDTDEEGVATFTVPKANYTVSFATVPEGYTAGAEEFEFLSDEYELIITLNSAG